MMDEYTSRSLIVLLKQEKRNLKSKKNIAPIMCCLTSVSARNAASRVDGVWSEKDCVALRQPFKTWF